MVSCSKVLPEGAITPTVIPVSNRLGKSGVTGKKVLEASDANANLARRTGRIKDPAARPKRNFRRSIILSKIIHNQGRNYPTMSYQSKLSARDWITSFAGFALHPNSSFAFLFLIILERPRSDAIDLSLELKKPQTLRGLSELLSRVSAERTLASALLIWRQSLSSVNFSLSKQISHPRRPV